MGSEPGGRRVRTDRDDDVTVLPPMEAMEEMVRNPERSIPGRPAHDRLIGRRPGRRAEERSRERSLFWEAFGNAASGPVDEDRGEPEGQEEQPPGPELGTGEVPTGEAPEPGELRDDPDPLATDDAADDEPVSPPRMDPAERPPLIADIVAAAEAELDLRRQLGWWVPKDNDDLEFEDPDRE